MLLVFCLRWLNDRHQHFHSRSGRLPDLRNPLSPPRRCAVPLPFCFLEQFASLNFPKLLLNFFVDLSVEVVLESLCGRLFLSVQILVSFMVTAEFLIDV